MTIKQDDNYLVGIDQITGHLGISKNTFYEFIGLGLPAAILGKRWYAHKDNVNLWVKKTTAVVQKSIPEDIL